jgi:hypothetical protein
MSPAARVPRTSSRSLPDRDVPVGVAVGPVGAARVVVDVEVHRHRVERIGRPLERVPEQMRRTLPAFRFLKCQLPSISVFVV